MFKAARESVPGPGQTPGHRDTSKEVCPVPSRVECPGQVGTGAGHVPVCPALREWLS